MLFCDVGRNALMAYDLIMLIGKRPERHVDHRLPVSLSPRLPVSLTPVSCLLPEMDDDASRFTGHSITHGIEERLPVILYEHLCQPSEGIHVLWLVW